MTAAILLLLTEFTLHRGAETVALSPSKASATVIVFISTICPVSDKYVDRLNALYGEYSAQGVQFVIANPNANEKWQDTDNYARGNGLLYPVYQDVGNRLADRIGAQSTPEAFVFDRSGRLRYRGQIDDATNPARVRSHSLRNALEAVVNRREVAVQRTRAVGCAIHRAK
jgi:AhpC/TSA family